MKKQLLIYLCFISLVRFNCKIWSQERTHDLDFHKIKDGISQAGVHTITQDANGFIWIGTHGAGIYRYDGMDYVSYRPKSYNHNTLTSSFVYSTFLDDTGRLWVGTDLGLALYDNDKDEFRHIPLQSTTNENLGNFGVTSLQGANGNLYVGTNQQGVFVMNLKDFKLEKIPFNNFDSDTFLAVNDIKITNRRVLYAATNKGLLEINHQNKTIDLALFRNGNEALTIPTALQSLFIDSENTIWAGSISNGVYSIHLADKQSVPSVKNFTLTSNTIFSLIESSDGDILCGTENDGLYRLDKNGEILQHYLYNKNDEKSILSNSIWSLYLDKDERIWMGYYNRGVVVHDKYRDKFRKLQSIYNKPNSLQMSSVTAIAGDSEGRLWIAMDGGGIDVYDKANNTFMHINTSNSYEYTGLTSDYIQSLFVDSEQNIWAGSWDKGLFFLKKGSKKFINYQFPIIRERKGSSAIMSFAEDSKGTIWIGSFNQGLYSYQLKNTKSNNFNPLSFKSHNLSEEYINKVLVDSHDIIWVASSNGLFKLEHTVENEIEVRLMNEFLASDKITSFRHLDFASLFSDAENILWAGVRGVGLLSFNAAKNEATWYNTSSGLTPNINAIINDSKGNLWLDGNSGITKFDRKTNEFTTYTKDDGLASNHFNKNAIYKSKEGILFFGGTEGIDYFNPNSIHKLETAPSVYLKNLKLFNENVLPCNNSPLNKALSQTDSITLNSKQSVFTIEYSGINYTRPEKNKYAYYLEGYEKDWNYVGDARSATYTNLDAGYYTFMVKAANSDGVWSKTPKTLNIQVLPPWWKTLWAFFIYGLVFSAALVLWRHVEKKRIIDKQQVKNERQKRIREDELHKERINFFTNVAHEFSSPLTLILNPIKDILKEESTNYSNRVQIKHRTIYKNTERLIRLISELLDFSKLESNKVKIHANNLNIVPFVKDIADHFKEEAISNQIDLKVNYNKDIIWLWADESMLEKIIFNLLSNAFKATPKEGSVSVYLEQKDNTVKISITDTRPSLEQGEQKVIFEEFHQAGALEKGSYDSTGIGLELVNSFVKLHSGSVYVNSELQKTTFSAVFPSGNKHFKSDEISEKSNLVPSFKKRLIKSNTLEEERLPAKTAKLTKTLLLVDGDIELRNYLKSEFKNEYKIVTAKNGNEGLLVALETLPDVIITDVLIAEMNGYDFCEAIRANSKTSHIPVMILTAKAKTENVILGIQKGADVYLSKPFDINLVRQHLSQLIYSREVIFNKYFKLMSETQEGASITSLDKNFIEKAINYIHDNMTNSNMGVESLAAHLNLSRSQLYRKIKSLTNQTANEFIRNQRLHKARKLLENGNTDLTDICNTIGISSTTYFSKRFKEYFGILPNEVNRDNL